MLVLETVKGTFSYPDISDPMFGEIARQARPHTRTFGAGIEAPWALYQSIEYLVRSNIPGDIVECGVWSGGSMLLAALALNHFGDTARRLFLYDTFSGIPRPEPVDARWDGMPALPTWEHYQQNGRAWCFRGTQEHVRGVMSSSGYPEERLVFVEGMVEDTIPVVAPERIALLRLDTDLYRSTYHELVHLWPRLVTGGVLIIDDYGAFQGARLATDQFIRENSLKLFPIRIDSSVRLALKTGL